jgi:ATP-dependent RNA helicase DeaD
MNCRLFLARGKIDGMTQSKIKDFIKKETDIDLGHIQQIDIYDKFSFLNVPFKDAEVILQIFKMKNKRQPLVVQAKKR